MGRKGGGTRNRRRAEYWDQSLPLNSVRPVCESSLNSSKCRRLSLFLTWMERDKPWPIKATPLQTLSSACSCAGQSTIDCASHEGVSSERCMGLVQGGCSADRTMRGEENMERMYNNTQQSISSRTSNPSFLSDQKMFNLWWTRGCWSLPRLVATCTSL